VFAVSGVAAGLLLERGWPWPVALGATLVLGGMAGLVNGVLVAGLRLPSIVVTLATMVTWREALRLARQGQFVNLPDGVQWFGAGQGTGQAAVLLAAVSVWALLAWALRSVSAGRWIYATGSDAEAARLAGLRPRTTTAGVFVLAGVLSAAAAGLNLVQSPQVDPGSGRLLELEAIAAAVVGGVAVSGGRGRLVGVLLGFLLLTCVGPALTYLGVKAWWDKAIQGAIILAAVVADGVGRGKRDGG
jgi:rhamnose transport system permease protein